MSRGLAPISVSQGTLISYATKDGSVAADGSGKNSPFTKALLQHIDSPDDIAVVLRRVRGSGDEGDRWAAAALGIRFAVWWLVDTVGDKGKVNR